MSFGQKLLSLRKVKGLSQDELGSQLKVSRQTISKWELGETTPELEKLISISELFNISLDELVKGEAASDVNPIDIDGSEIKVEKPKKGAYDIILLLVKLAGVIFLVDLIILIIYFVFNGFPPK